MSGTAKKDKPATVDEDRKAFIEIINYATTNLLPIYVYCTLGAALSDLCSTTELTDNQRRDIGALAILVEGKKTEMVAHAAPNWKGIVLELMPSPAEYADMQEQELRNNARSARESLAIIKDSGMTDIFTIMKLATEGTAMATKNINYLETLAGDGTFPIKLRESLRQALIDKEKRALQEVRKADLSEGLNETTRSLLKDCERSLLSDIETYYTDLLGEGGHDREHVYRAQEEEKATLERLRALERHEDSSLKDVFREIVSRRTSKKRRTELVGICINSFIAQNTAHEILGKVIAAAVPHEADEGVDADATGSS
ncbi:MAG: hypothetical protein M1528_01235 [Candidatus Marsarchaeota archaeon]|jgi:hypothetical protein|nr:hypothetical protein [Candidatus Marsarchaeota archaeon]MCL5115141.1 hypothetical protein [Candidatus Marsarchaeota archaeon]